MASVFGINFTSKSMTELVESINRESVPAQAGPRMVVTANTDHIVQLRHNAEFRAAYGSAWAATIDGTPVLLYARLKGARALARITGADLVSVLIPALSPRRQRCFFVVSTAETAERLGADLQSRGFPAETMGFEVPPRRFEDDVEYGNALAKRIEGHRATHLFLGVGAPKSEVWAHRHRNRLGDCYVLCVGTALDFHVGLRRRAPVFIRHCGLEWLWRFGQEPRRLFNRYFVRSWGVLGAIREDLLASFLGYPAR